jgi:hypothetical protein
MGGCPVGVPPHSALNPGVEGEGNRLVGGQRLAFRPGVSEGGFV